MQTQTGQRDEIETEGSSARAAEISRLFREHNRALVLFLASRLRDAQAAHEVAQEAYVRLLQLESPGAVSFLRSYLFKVAGNLAIDRIRQQQARARIDQKSEFENFLHDSLPERAAIARDELEFLARVVRELPTKYQQAFRMHRLEDRSFADIASEMNIKERMVRRYVTNALIYLRLRREGVSSDEAWQRIHA